MKSYFLAFVVLILAVDAVKALECYACAYLEGVDLGDFGNGVQIDKSCRSGKKPKGKLALTCPLAYDVCVKLFAEGTLNSGEKVKATVRGCGIRKDFPGYTGDICESRTSAELSEWFGEELPTNFKGSSCFCGDDKCNSSSMLKITQSLILVGLCVFSSKFMGLY